ncbi:hypothetical protein Droror1_Dr00007749 [Drosera rotundifolia]
MSQAGYSDLFKGALHTTKETICVLKSLGLAAVHSFAHHHVFSPPSPNLTTAPTSDLAAVPFAEQRPPGIEGCRAPGSSPGNPRDARQRRHAGKQGQAGRQLGRGSPSFLWPKQTGYKPMPGSQLQGTRPTNKPKAGQQGRGGFHSQFTLFTTTPPLHSPSSSPAATSRFNSLHTQTLRHASRFLRRTTTSRLLMREPSMVVCEAAAAQFEERQTEWVYSRPVVVMDVLWNLRFVVVAAVVLGLSWDEKPGVPVRVWVAGGAWLTKIWLILSMFLRLDLMGLCFEGERLKLW